jgi:NAD-dependent dihydropyrimidine dehydrogenase PreA subunit
MRTFITKMRVCTNCGVAHPATQQDGLYIDGGLSFDLLNMGHYGGMWDNFPRGDRDELAHLCHDCSVGFLRAYPNLAKLVLPNGGGHPNYVHNPTMEKDSQRGTDTPSCCEFAWTWNTDELDENGQWMTYVGTADGGWRKREWVEV